MSRMKGRKGRSLCEDVISYVPECAWSKCMATKTSEVDPCHTFGSPVVRLPSHRYTRLLRKSGKTPVDSGKDSDHMDTGDQ